MTLRGGDALTQATRLAGDLPGLLLAAEKTAHTFMRGVHGRRRVGQGETFWQFRHYQPGDSSRDIDWRQTARRDAPFVRQLEWEAAQTLWLYRDASASMDFHADAAMPTKKDFAEILLLSLGIVALNGGEQVGLAGTSLSPQAHDGAIRRIFDTLPEQRALAAPLGRPVSSRSQMVVFSDFFMPPEELFSFCLPLAEKGVAGLLVQVNDPVEETLAYQGRVRFTDPEDTSAAAVTIAQVEAVREEYLRLFTARREDIAARAAACGWRFMTARTDEKPEAVLTRLHTALTAQR